MVHYVNHDENGCTDMKELLNKTLKHWERKKPKIVLVNRGDCSFVTKVKHAEEAGAIAAIIIDNKNENIDNIVMSDDGNGGGIHIPSVLIGKKDGDKIIKYTTEHSHRHLVAILDFDLPNPDNHVEYELYISSANKKSREFINDWANVSKLLDNNISFDLHFILWYCVECFKDN